MIDYILIAILLQLLLIANAFIILGFHLATKEGMILHFVEKACNRIPDFWCKPIYACPTCMASAHSTYLFIPIAYICQISFWLYPIYILALAGLSTIVYKIYEHLSEPEIIDYHEN